MTTPASPDGQPQTPASPTPAPTTTGSPPPAQPTAEEIRDWGEVRKIIAQRDELKSEIAEIKAAIIKMTPAAPAAPAPTGQDAIAADIAKRLEQLEAMRSAEQRAERRKALESAVVSAATEAERDKIRGALALLAIDGHVDLYADDAGTEAAKALARLRALHPGAFVTPGASGTAPTGGHDPIPPGMELHELSREQLARLTDEDCSKLRKLAKKSTLAV